MRFGCVMTVDSTPAVAMKYFDPYSDFDWEITEERMRHIAKQIRAFTEQKKDEWYVDQIDGKDVTPMKVIKWNGQIIVESARRF